MNNSYTVGIANLAQISVGPWILAILLWSIVWKGLALWHSAQRRQPWWFVVMLLINTVGILEIVYLFAVLKLKFSELFVKQTPMISRQEPPSQHPAEPHHG